MAMTISVLYELDDGDERKIEVEVRYEPGRPPPRIDPRLYDATLCDPGDPEELEILKATDASTEEDLTDKVADDERFADAVLDAIRREL